MIKFPAIQTKVCEDTIRRMQQAQLQKNKVAFELEKNKLLDSLAILKTGSFSTYKKYFKFGELTFNSDD